MDEFPSKYNPKGIEEKWYKFWMDKNFFTPNLKSKKETYTIVIPPPNVTGRLTLGHILDNSIQDILIRYKKLSGYNVLWVSGMDHAGIATQVVVEEKLLKQGIKRQELGREKFIQEVRRWKEEYAEVIRQQLKKMGCGLDWTRESFTLSEDYSKKVIKVFVELYNKGLIYRGECIINWCPRCQTALSNEQVETEKRIGKLYYIKYPIINSNNFITVATTRPETMLGDTAVCVNPQDERYKNLIGKNALLPIVKREIPIIADSYVDLEFGTGALKVTPAHDPFDFELAKKHNLKFINIMNPDATLNKNAGEFQGLERYEAREKIIKELSRHNLTERIEDYEVPLSMCERCHTPIEPKLSKQWFVKMKPLAQPALAAVKKSKIKFYPSRWVNLYNHWMENIRDWCISRQLWWGHKIPVYYCSRCFNKEKEDTRGIMVATKKPEKCPDCGGTNIYQDKDVLDTWFSSWLWPFAVFGWPDDTEDYRRFYPTSTLATGWDIIYLWVARMIMAGLEFTHKIPFRDVVFHPMIRDEKGRKMSKSLGNSPEPMDLIEKYGADALRFGLQLITPKEQDVLFSEKAIEVGRKFCNKLWNAARLIWLNYKDTEGLLPEDLSMWDTWILNEFNNLLAGIERHFSNYELNAIAREVYEFFWHSFCDWYLEFNKLEPSTTAKYLLKRIIIILHPFIPFITEAIYHKFNFRKESILLERWPKKIKIEKDITDVDRVIRLIEGIRNIRGLFNIPAKEKLNIIINAKTKYADFLKENIIVLRKIVNLRNIEFDKPLSQPVASIITPEIESFVILSGIDITKEKNRLLKEIKYLSGRIDEIKYRLSNPKYLSQASEQVKERERQRLEDFFKKKEGIQRAIERL